MTNALPRAPESFFTPSTGGRHRTFPHYFGRLKMASDLESNGGRLSASFNGGQRDISFSAKAEAERDNGGNSLDEGRLSYNDRLEYDKIVHIWWDFERCPLPLNFDAPKIASNITRALHRRDDIWIHGVPLYYFHAYGNVQTMGEDIIRFVRESGFQMIGFQLKECFCSIRDLPGSLRRPPIIPIFISDGYGDEYYSRLDRLLDEEYQIMPLDMLLE